MSKEYIEREAAICEMLFRYWDGKETLRQIMESIPAADVAPVRHGEWKKRKGRDTIKCSSCGFQMFPLDAYQKGEWPNMCVTFCDEQKYIPRFCPDCGARMDA